MKSLTNAIIGVTSGVAAFVVLDLLRHHGVEMPSIEWDRATLLAKTAEAESGEASAGEIGDLLAPIAAAIAFDDGAESVVVAETPKCPETVVAAPWPDRPPAIDLEGVVVEREGLVVAAEVSESGESRAATPVPPRPTASPVSESTPSDLTRAGERAKALAAAMERLGKRLDGTANRRFPR
ncbi:MAG: hypothetical protein ACO3EP_10655 [Phycisphaerales bacterium]